MPTAPLRWTARFVTVSSCPPHARPPPLTTGPRASACWTLCLTRCSTATLTAQPGPTTSSGGDTRLRGTAPAGACPHEALHARWPGSWLGQRPPTPANTLTRALTHTTSSESVTGRGPQAASPSTQHALLASCLVGCLVGWGAHPSGNVVFNRFWVGQGWPCTCDDVYKAIFFRSRGSGPHNWRAVCGGRYGVLPCKARVVPPVALLA